VTVKYGGRFLVLLCITAAYIITPILTGIAAACLLLVLAGAIVMLLQACPLQLTLLYSVLILVACLLGQRNCTTPQNKTNDQKK
jgi:hypothetical protein